MVRVSYYNLGDNQSKKFIKNSEINSRNPNNATDEHLRFMVWPKHDSATESYLDIGNHLVEKNGLFLERFTVWDNFEVNSTDYV